MLWLLRLLYLGVSGSFSSSLTLWCERLSEVYQDSPSSPVEPQPSISCCSQIILLSTSLQNHLVLSMRFRMLPRTCTWLKASFIFDMDAFMASASVSSALQFQSFSKLFTCLFLMLQFFSFFAHWREIFIALDFIWAEFVLASSTVGPTSKSSRATQRYISFVSFG